MRRKYLIQVLPLNGEAQSMAVTREVTLFGDVTLEQMTDAVHKHLHDGVDDLKRFLTRENVRTLLDQSMLNNEEGASEDGVQS